VAPAWQASITLCVAPAWQARVTLTSARLVFVGVAAVALVNGTDVALVRQVAVNTRVFRYHGRLVEVVHILHVRVSQASLNHKRGIWSDQHGDCVAKEAVKTRSAREQGKDKIAIINTT